MFSFGNILKQQGNFRTVARKVKCPRVWGRGPNSGAPGGYGAGSPDASRAARQWLGRADLRLAYRRSFVLFSLCMLPQPHGQPCQKVECECQINQEEAVVNQTVGQTIDQGPEQPYSQSPLPFRH
jgi:hypothetical protein